MVLKRCPGRWRSDKSCGMKGSLLKCVVFCIQWNGNQNFMSVNSFFSFSSNSCAPKKVQNYKISFFWSCISKSQLQNLWIFTAFYPSNNFPSIISARPSPKWHWVALGVAGHGWVWLTACWRSRPRPTRSVLGLKGKTNWLQLRALWKAGWNWVELPTVNQSHISVRVSCNATSGSWKSTGLSVKFLGLLKGMKKRYQGPVWATGD